MRPHAIGPDGFEAKFRHDIDPWDYETSPFEARKRRLTIRACGPGKAARALELGCAIGMTTAGLTAKARRIDAIDAAPAALAAARRRGLARVRFILGLLPGAVPRRRYDLIVASEILYYLTERQFAALLRRLAAALRPGGTVVLAHHVVPIHDAAIVPAQAHQRALRALAGRGRIVSDHRHGRFRISAVTFRHGR